MQMNAAAIFLTFAAAMLTSAAAISAEGPVVWADATCDYVIIQLPEENPDEAFGLYKSRTKPMPKVGDIVEGDILAAFDVEVTEIATGQKYSLFHWANGKSRETLVRHSPVQCASRYKK